MRMTRRPGWTTPTILMLALLAGSMAVEAATPGAERDVASREPDAHPGRILVRLPRALDGMLEDGSFPVRTGLEHVDALIAESGVFRIEHALPVSARNPGNPLAFRRHGLARTYRFRLAFGADARAVAEAFDALDDVDPGKKEKKKKGWFG